MATFKQGFKEAVRQTVKESVLDLAWTVIGLAFPHGKVGAVAADGKHANLYVNASSTTTDNVPVAPHVGTLAVGDEVILLRRAPRDLQVIAKKTL